MQCATYQQKGKTSFSLLRGSITLKKCTLETPFCLAEKMCSLDLEDCEPQIPEEYLHEKPVSKKKGEATNSPDSNGKGNTAATLSSGKGNTGFSIFHYLEASPFSGFIN